MLLLRRKGSKSGHCVSVRCKANLGPTAGSVEESLGWWLGDAGEGGQGEKQATAGDLIPLPLPHGLLLP